MKFLTVVSLAASATLALAEETLVQQDQHLRHQNCTVLLPDPRGRKCTNSHQNNLCGIGQIRTPEENTCILNNGLWTQYPAKDPKRCGTFTLVPISECSYRISSLSGPCGFDHNDALACGLTVESHIFDAVDDIIDVYETGDVPPIGKSKPVYNKPGHIKPTKTCRSKRPHKTHTHKHKTSTSHSAQTTQTSTSSHTTTLHKTHKIRPSHSSHSTSHTRKSHSHGPHTTTTTSSSSATSTTARPSTTTALALLPREDYPEHELSEQFLEHSLEARARGRRPPRCRTFVKEEPFLFYPQAPF